MPKPHTYPILYNEVLSLSITNLKKWGYLQPKQVKGGIINWKVNSNIASSATIKGSMNTEQPYIELSYKYEGKDYFYKVYLTSIKSNLKIGKIWYFVCPRTNERCMKLYLLDGIFCHRKAIKGCMYEIQKQSKLERLISKYTNYCNISDLLECEMYQKNFKRMYAGKPTKKYLRISQKVNITNKLLKREYLIDHP